MGKECTSITMHATHLSAMLKFQITLFLKVILVRTLRQEKIKFDAHNDFFIDCKGFPLKIISKDIGDSFMDYKKTAHYSLF